jgi:hypothetical protein
MKLSTLGVPLLCALIAACAPSINVTTMQSVDETTLVSPTQKQVPFALRSSDLYLLPAGASSSSTTANAVPLADACIPKGAKKSPETKVSLKKIDLSQPPSTSGWEKCLDGLQMVVTPTRGNIYLATAGRNTTVTVTPMDTDPLLLKSVAIGQVQTPSDTVTTMSTDVAAGIALGGPWGAAAGSLGAIGALLNATSEETYDLDINSSNLLLGYRGDEQSRQALVTKKKKAVAAKIDSRWVVPGWNILQNKLVCDVDVEHYDYSHYSYQEPATFTLPATVPVTITESSTSTEDKRKCWTPLPAVLPTGQSKVQALWFYRIIATGPDLPAKSGADAIEFPPVLKRDVTDNRFNTIVSAKSFFGTTTTPSANQFPTSACRSVEVDLAFWKELDKPAGPPQKNSDGTTTLTYRDQPLYKSYKVVVADPNYVQVVNVQNQKSQVINFNPVCGAYVSNTTAPPSATDFMSALVQGAQTVKKAEPAKSGSSSN